MEYNIQRDFDGSMQQIIRFLSHVHVADKEQKENDLYAVRQLRKKILSYMSLLQREQNLMSKNLEKLEKTIPKLVALDKSESKKQVEIKRKDIVCRGKDGSIGIVTRVSDNYYYISWDHEPECMYGISKEENLVVINKELWG